MTTKQDILNLFTDDVQSRRNAIHAYLLDHTNSYEDRKEVFLATPEHLYSSNPWVISLPEYEDVHGEISWEDDFYKNRYEVVDLLDICKGAELMGIKAHNDLIKAIVNNGIHSFELDW